MSSFDDALSIGGDPRQPDPEDIRRQAEAQIPPLKVYNIEYLDGSGELRTKQVVANAMAAADDGKAVKFLSVAFIPSIPSIRSEVLLFIASDYILVENAGELPARVGGVN